MVMSENLKRAVTIFISATIVFSMLAYVAVTPRPKEQFFQIYVLGEGGKAERYYPSNNPSIPVGQMVRWRLGVTNFMGSVQYVVLRMKLGNSTVKPPDDASYSPSSAPILLEFKRVLVDNETWEFPVVWTMREIRVNGSVITPSSFEVNGVPVRNNDVSALKGYNFRVFFELWSFDSENGAVVFGWRTGVERRVAWLQIWFNATAPIPG
jgi:uncharacterized membrane protein